MRSTLLFIFLLFFTPSIFATCIDDAANTFNSSGRIFFGGNAYIINNPDSTLSAYEIKNAADTPNDSCKDQATRCTESGPISFTPFLNIPSYNSPSVSQSFSDTGNSDKDYTSSTIENNAKRFRTVKVRASANVTMNVKSSTSEFRIKTLTLDDIGSKLTITKSTPYAVAIEDAGSGSGGIKHNTTLTLENASSFKTRGLVQGEESTVNLPDMTDIQAGKWDIGKNATLNIDGTNGDYRFKNGINTSGFAMAGSSLNVKSADYFYSQGLKIANFDIHADTLYINGDFTVDENGVLKINPNQNSRVIMKANANVEFKYGSKIYLAPGDYYFQNLKIGSNVEIIPTGDGTVRLFTYSSFNDASSGSGMKINDGGDPSKLLLYSKNSVQLNGNSKVAGLVISEKGDVKLAITGASVTGSVIAGGNVYIDAGTSITYDSRVKGIDSGSSETECIITSTDIVGNADGVVSHADIVNNFTVANYNSGTKVITTKVANKVETITGVHLNDSGEAAVFNSTDPDTTFQIIPYLSNSDCTQRSVIYDTNGDPAIITITNGNASSNIDVQMPTTVTKDARFYITALDFEKAYADSSVNCAQKSTTTGNLAGIPQCANSENTYKAIFGQAAYDRCAVNNGQPCQSNHHGRGTGIYNNDYGCLMCTLDANTSCSSDHFAIRPDRFEITPNTVGNLRAGTTYNYTIDAKEYNSINNATDYAVTDGTADIQISTPHKYLQDNSEDNSLAGNYSFANNFTIANGTGTASIIFDDIGLMTLHLQDTKWAKIDENDTAQDCDHAFICGEVNATFIPDHFTFSNVSLHNEGDLGFTYLANIPFLNNDINISAHIGLTIDAKNALEVTTQNFAYNKWEKPVKLTFALTTANTPTLLVDNIDPEKILKFVNGSLIIPWNETNNTKNISFNFTRATNIPLNPFQVLGSDITLNSLATYGADTVIGIDNTATGNATFVYERTNVPRQKFVGTGNKTALLYYETYCSGVDSNGITCNTTLLPNGATSTYNDDSRWFINTLHTNALGTAGTVTQIQGNSVTITDPTGTNPDQITVNYDGTRGYPYTASFQNAASSWLIFDQFNAAAIVNRFTLEFYKNDGDYVGDGNSTSNVVPFDSSNTDVNENKSWW